MSNDNYSNNSKWQTTIKQTDVRYVVRTVEASGTRWRVLSKKTLLDLNPHDVVEAYEVGKPVRLSVSVQI